jgi:ABC-type nickel/cobalt efflux system permease component RcnA
LAILALRGLGTARSGTLFGIAPFVATTLSLLLLNDKPQILFWAALPIMLIGAWLMLTENHQHQHVHEPLEHTHAPHHPGEHHIHEHTPEELGEKGKHSHAHQHDRLVHSHPHVPDLHHRHAHSD